MFMTTTDEHLSAFLITISGFFVRAKRPALFPFVRLFCLFLLGLLQSKLFLKVNLKLFSEM